MIAISHGRFWNAFCAIAAGASSGAGAGRRTSRTLSSLQAISLVCVSAFAGAASGADDTYVADKTTGCKVFRPNVQANEAVAWNGKCVDGMADGSGRAQWSTAGKPTVSFDGTFRSGRLQGRGAMRAEGGDRYDGDYKDGMRDGKGVYFATNGERYEGGYKNNRRDGPGVLTDARGNRTEGVFQAGTMISQQSAASGVTAATIIGSSKPETVSLPARGASAGVSAPPSYAAKKGQETSTASGTVLRIDSCGAYPIVVGVPPKSMNVATSTPTGTYRNIQGAGGIFPILDEALELLAKNCPNVTRTVLQFYLLVDGLPAPAPIWPNTKDYDFGVTGSGGSGGWQVQNRVADRLKRQAIDRSQLAAAQQAQARVATQQQEVIARRTAFFKQYGAIEIPNMAILRSNPFALEGKTIAIQVAFHQMTSPTTGRFEAIATSLHDRGGEVTVSDIPRGTFLQPTYAFLAVKVLGLTPVQGNQGGDPHLKYVGVVICPNTNTVCP